MSLIDKLAEQKIAEAIKRGEFADLPGQGMPLSLEEDALVPEELRAGYRLLKNAGYLPPELNLRRDISSVEALLVQARCGEERTALSKRRNYLLAQLGIMRPDSPLFSESACLDKLKQQK